MIQRDFLRAPLSWPRFFSFGDSCFSSATFVFFVAVAGTAAAALGRAGDLAGVDRAAAACNLSSTL